MGKAGDGAKGVAQDGPTELEDLVFDGRERRAGEPDRSVGEVGFGNSLEVRREHADFFELARGARDGSARFGETDEERVGEFGTRFFGERDHGFGAWV